MHLFLLSMVWVEGSLTSWLANLIQAPNVVGLFSQKWRQAAENIPPSYMLSDLVTQGCSPSRANVCCPCVRCLSRVWLFWSSLDDSSWIWQGSSLLPLNNSPADQPCLHWLFAHWQSCFAAKEALQLSSSWGSGSVTCTSQTSCTTKIKVHHFLHNHPNVLLCQ